MAVLHFIPSLTGVAKEWKNKFYNKGCSFFFPKQRENRGRKAVNLTDAFAAYIFWKLGELVFCVSFQIPEADKCLWVLFSKAEVSKAKK